MGLSFHETVRGRNFFEGQLPQLIESLTKIADNMENISKLVNSPTVVYVCYHENSPELSIENPIVQQMCIAYSLDEVKSIMLDWLEDGESNKYIPLNEYDQMELFSDIMLGKDTSLPIYYNKDANSDLYYSLTVKMCSAKNAERKIKMTDERNQFQITRKDAKNCFVESLSDAFSIGKVHLNFASYDLTKPAGNRQTDMVAIYLDADEFLELCRKLSCGEFRYMVQNKKQSGDRTYLFQSLGGTSAEKLKAQGRARPDGKSLSRTLQILVGNKTDLLLVADSGPGETNEKGLIVPKFGNKPENHVTVSMTLDTFGELMLLTKAHYEAWLAAWYTSKNNHIQRVVSTQSTQIKKENLPSGIQSAVSNQFF